MEERIVHLENLAQISATLFRIVEEHASSMEERQRQAEERQRQAEDWQRQAEDWQRQTEVGQRYRDELLQQLLQATAVLQADIVRLDETYS